MTGAWTTFKRELASYLRSPIGYLIAFLLYLLRGAEVNSLLQNFKRRIKAFDMSDLQNRAAKRGQTLQRASCLQAVRQRLLDHYSNAGFQKWASDFVMKNSRNRDDHAIDDPDERARVRDGRRADVGRERGGPRGVGVRDQQLVDVREAAQEACVQHADPPGTDQSDPHPQDPPSPPPSASPARRCVIDCVPH